ncbi:hypothetical protein [Paenibacillus glycinis]|nr:hypothetical protein [Paenibacillus glycinis]
MAASIAKDRIDKSDGEPSSRSIASTLSAARAENGGIGMSSTYG